MWLQSSLNADSEAAGTNCTRHLEAKFLLNSDILYEVTCFGLADADNKVRTFSLFFYFFYFFNKVITAYVCASNS